MAEPEEQSAGHGNGTVIFEWVYREFGLTVDRTSAAEREADRELTNSWLQTIHGFQLDPFFLPIVSASFEESGEEMECLPFPTV